MHRQPRSVRNRRRQYLPLPHRIQNRQRSLDHTLLQGYLPLPCRQEQHRLRRRHLLQGKLSLPFGPAPLSGVGPLSLCGISLLPIAPERGLEDAAAPSLAIPARRHRKARSLRMQPGRMVPPIRSRLYGRSGQRRPRRLARRSPTRSTPARSRSTRPSRPGRRSGGGPARHSSTKCRFTMHGHSPGSCPWIGTGLCWRSIRPRSPTSSTRISSPASTTPRSSSWSSASAAPRGWLCSTTRCVRETKASSRHARSASRCCGRTTTTPSGRALSVCARSCPTRRSGCLRTASRSSRSGAPSASPSAPTRLRWSMRAPLRRTI